ncbi:hypothetical protein P4H71_25795 [Paenibacillus kribbensis]|uniref:hypothetical protein n=1 Tax=Paenibacillus kribbensis TaxID=172713 RepID=UPI002DC01A6D|nr:hypothetical protein [Paenibacillus kribbensis]MEC0237734.1 hypothetical protein [Paenibacillus kribbensis]
MSMNIFKAKKGNKVRYMDRGGYDKEREWDSKHLVKGQAYTIDRVEIHQSSTTVYLDEVPGRGFNSVCFNDVFEEVNGIDYGRIHQLTNAEFTHFVKDKVEKSLEWKRLERFLISIEDFGCDPHEDPPVIVIDVKVTGMLWTFWFDTDEGKYNYSVLGEDVVNRYLAIAKGEKPELPGVYTYD